MSHYAPVNTTDGPQDNAFDPFAVSEKTHIHEFQQYEYSDSPRGYEHYGEPSYTSAKAGGFASDASLVPKATERPASNYQDLDYAEPYPQPPPLDNKSPLARFFGGGESSLQQRIDMKKRGVGRQQYPFVAWVLTAVMTGVLIFELVANKQDQGSVFSFKPVVNYMLGPSSTTLINVGARFPPCMKFVQSVPPTTLIGCLNNTANPATEICTIEEICGFGGFPDDAPNQWFRFMTPVFLHAGLVHLLLNMLAQLTVSAQVEREMGSISFFIVYFAAGIWGNVLGANFALVGRPSVGASGAIFGTVAVTWVDLFAHWKYRYRPGRKLAFMAVELVIGVAMGYIPFVDNFAHLGGFLMALLVGMTLYPIISETRRHKMIVLALRVVAIVLAIVLYVVLTRNFYESDPYAACEWCRYLSCFPTSSNSYCKGTGLTTSSSAT
uniref:Rhomboid-type serine protease n=1 Tax=Mycena chlorophos TaxID=658473 RepID=A0ABQ0KYX1_MYCCL|nr:predicted protein [Mycena chlorophos]